MSRIASLRSDLAWVAVGALAAALAFLLAAPKYLLPAANAGDAISCLNAVTPPDDDDYGQWQAEERDSTYQDLRGLRTDVIYPTADDCQRISSIYVFSPTGNGFYEFGILLGWTGPAGDRCGGDYYGSNILFSVWRSNTASHESCTIFARANPGLTHSIRASDINGNTYWGGFYDGTALQPDGVNLDWSKGQMGVNVERGNPDDRCPAEFQAIEEFHDGNGWTYTDDLRHVIDVGPDCHLEIDTNEHHVTVVHN